jgi:cytochrome c-type biogenesis protein CcmH
LTWLWLILAAMLVGALAAILVPLARRKEPPAERAAYDVEGGRAQLAEGERDLERGLLNVTEAAAARTEIGRRVLAAAAPTNEAPPPPSRLREIGPLAIAAVLPIVAFVLYLGLGSPGIPGRPVATRAPAADTQAPHETTEMVGRLKERLKADPQDVEGWVMLARSYQTLRQYADAAAAWRQARALVPGEPEILGPLGDGLVMAADGIVTPEAMAAFEEARSVSPGDPRTLYYVGLAQAQRGEADKGLQTWIDLEALSPPDASWLPMLRERIKLLAGEAKLDPATFKPSPQVKTIQAMQAAEAAQAAQAPAQPESASSGRPTVPLQPGEKPSAAPPPASAPTRGPSAADVAAAQNMSADDRQAMIRTMVDSLAARLEAEPNDLEGWRRLGRAWRVLGEGEKSKLAYAKAAALAPDKIEVLKEYGSSLIQGASPDSPLPSEFVKVMGQVLKLDPNEHDALWFAGLGAVQSGNKAEARQLWQRLVERLPPGSKEQAQVQQRLDQLKATN